MAWLADVWKKAWFGLLFMGMGIFSVVMVLSHPEGAEAPVWVAVVAGSTFFFAGLSALLKSFGVERASSWLVLPAIFGLAVPGLWLLFAGGDAKCSVGLGFAGFSGAGAIDSLLCRGVFGFGALLVLAMGVVFTLAAMRGRGGKRPDAGSDSAGQ